MTFALPLFLPQEKHRPDHHEVRICFNHPHAQLCKSLGRRFLRIEDRGLRNVHFTGGPRRPPFLHHDRRPIPMGAGGDHRPLEEQDKALSVELPRLQGEIDALEIRQISSTDVITEATQLHKLWPNFDVPQKRRIIESIVERITVTKDEIDVTYWSSPSSEELTKEQRNLIAALPPCERRVTYARRHVYRVRYLPIPIVESPETHGERLRKKRFEMQITQAQAAKILGVDQTTVSFWECDRARPDPKNLSAVMAFLGGILDGN